METIMTDELSRILAYATDEAMRTGFMEICPDHIILATIRDGANEAFDTLSSLGLDMIECKHFIESRISKGVLIPYDRKDEVCLSRDAGSLMNMAMLEAKNSGSVKTGTMHLFSALMKFSLCEGRSYLIEMGIDSSAFALHREAAKEKPHLPKATRFIIHINDKSIS